MSKNTSTHLEHKVIGRGATNVVFLNGFRMQFDSWNKVCPDISLENKLILFNRRGVGASSKATEAQDGITVISEIRSLLSNLTINPPYILVAHSLGGIFANLYACVYPSEIAGIVFVDAPHPSEVAEQRKIKPPRAVNAINEGIKYIEKLFDKYKYSEDEYIKKTIAQIELAGQFPNIPMAVVSGTKKMPFVPEKAFELHQHYQTKLMSLSPKSTRYLCNESGHFPQVTEPDIVAKAILNTIDVVISRTPTLTNHR